MTMAFFFEAYKEGNFNAIRQRFTLLNEKVLNDHQIIGLYKYLEYISYIEFDQGTNDQAEAGQYAAHSSFGSLTAVALKKSYALVEDQMTNWLSTRFLAATLDLDETVTCRKYFKHALSNDTKVDVQKTCAMYQFDNLTSLYPLDMGKKNATIG